MTRYILFISILLTVSFNLHAQLYGPQTEQFSAVATWLTPPEEVAAPNQWLEWTTTLSLTEVPDRLPLRIATDSKYWLYLNDSLIVFEGQLRRGPTPTATYFDILDIAPYVTEGENSAYLLQWFWGKEGFNHKNSGAAGLLLDLEGHPLTAADWTVNRHPAYGETGDPKPNYRLPESNVHFDARLDAGDRSNTQTPVTAGPPGTAPWGDLWPRPFRSGSTVDWSPYERLEEEETDSSLIVRAYLPLNITITPYFDITAPAEGELIDLRTDNYRGGGSPNVRGEYITRTGRQSYEQLAFMNGHYMMYTFPKGTEVHELAYRETRYPANYTGSFTCNDNSLNVLWDKSLTTLNVNIRDAIQDSPDRERAQWWGDVVIVMEELFYAADTTAFPLIRKAISNLVEWQKPDGALYSPVPAGNWDQELPTQMLASVSSMPTYFAYTGDTATLAYVYPHFRRYLDLYAILDDGLVEERRGGWTWLDWGENIDSTAVYNVWYHKALRSMQLMERVLGRDTQATDSLILLTVEPSTRDSQPPAGYRGPRKQGPIDDRPQGIAVVAGLVPEEYYPVVDSVLRGPYHASPYSEKYILEALFEMQQPEHALQRMKERYRNMIDHPDYTTLWEGWGIGAEGYGGGTYNHGWSGGPLTLLSKYVAGVAPTSPGYGSFRVAPQPGGLTQVQATVPSVRGPFTVSYRIDGDHMNFHLTVPEGTEGEVVLPPGYRIDYLNHARYHPPADAPNRVYLNSSSPRALHLCATHTGQYRMR